MRTPAMCALLLLCVLHLAAGQAPDQTAAALARLAAASREYTQAVPNFACTELIHTRLLVKGKERRHATFKTALRVLRQPDGTLDENFAITEFDGRPPVMGKAMPTLGYVTGGLAGGLFSYFDASLQPCYRYALSGRQMAFTPSGAGPPGCSKHNAGLGLLDDDGNLLQGEIHRATGVYGPPPWLQSAAIDYAAVRLGETTYRMPTHLYAEMMIHADVVTTFDGQYTDCHLYKATSTIEPAVGVVP